MGIAIKEAIEVIINVPTRAGFIPPALNSSPGGLGSRVNRSRLI